MDLTGIIDGIKFRAKQAAVPVAVGAAMFFTGAIYGRDLGQNIEFMYRGVPADKQYTTHYDGKNPSFKITVRKGSRNMSLNEFGEMQFFTLPSQTQKSIAADTTYRLFNSEEKKTLTSDLMQDMSPGDRGSLFAEETKYQFKAMFGSYGTEQPKYWQYEKKF